MNSDSLFVKCDCATEVLEIEHYYYDEKDCGFYLSMWDRYGNSRKLTWIERIKWCINILSGRKLYTDCIILSNENAENITKYITEKIKQNNAMEDIVQHSNSGKYIVVRGGIRVSENEYNSPTDPEIVSEKDFWSEVSKKYSNKEKVEIIPFDMKKHKK